MKLSFATLIGATVLAASATAQVVIPPHSSVYNGYTRGFNFTAANNFIINQLELPLNAFQAGDTASFYVRVNGANTFYSAGTPGPAVGCSILVNPGDVVDVLGNWSPAAPGTFTAHNSYGNTAPYATSILGVATTLNRTGIQNDIGNPGWVQGTGYLAPTTGAIGRVLMYAVPPTGTYVNFTSDVTTGASPLAVNFTDQTYTSDPVGVLAWAWDLDGDSVIDSTLQNPSFTYTNCGTYDVTLTTVDGTYGANSVTKTALIVTDTVSANFTYAAIAPGVFQFTDTSTPTPTSWAWDLDGDNVVDDTTQNPAFFYPAPCTAVNVTLTANRLCGPSSSKSKQIVISPNSLTATNNGGNGTTSATWVGNMFNISVTNPQGIKICALSQRTYAFSGPMNVSVYISSGSYADVVNGAARYAQSSLWRQVATGTGTATNGALSGAVTQDFVALNTPIYLPQGDYCMAVYVNNPAGTAGIGYTNGPIAPAVDANVTMFASGNGIASYALFGTGVFNPRCWNGTLHYSTFADDGLASIGLAGTGCSGSAPASQITASGAPQLGSSVTLTANNLPAGAMVMIVGFGRYQPSPLDLTAYGAPNCAVRTAIDASSFNIGGSWSLAIPSVPAFAGMKLFNQALVLDPAGNALGAVMSDATGMVLGN